MGHSKGLFLGALFFAFILIGSISNAEIYGKDDRKPISRDFAVKMGLKPIVNIAIKKTTGNFNCTGSWISKTHILTARHCVANAQKILIYNQYDKYLSESKATGKRVYVDVGSPKDQSKWYGRAGPNSDGRPQKNDWAVVEIEEEINGADPVLIYNPVENKMIKNIHRYEDGLEMGTLPIGYSKSLNENPWITLAAYHDDAYNALYREQCRYRPRDLKAHYQLMYRQGLFEFDCDINTGASGAPILSCNGSHCTIVGIVSGQYLAEEPPKEFSHKYGNSAVKSENFVWAVNRLMKGDLMYVKSFDLEKMTCKLTDCLKQ